MCAPDDWDAQRVSAAWMDGMSPQQAAMGRTGTDTLAGDAKPPHDGKKKMKTLAQRRQSAPSLIISKAFTRSRSVSREACLTPVSPESCPLVQAFLAEGAGRDFLGHAQAQLKTGLQTQERHLFLFTDTLLVTKAKSPTHFKVKAQVRVCEMWTASCMEEVCEGSTSPERSFVMGWPTCNCVATFSSEEQKEKWLALITSQISEGKENDDPKTVPLKIFAKDIGSCAFAKTLSVSNTDSTMEVIRMALLQFGISGCAKDHRLWVSSSREDPPYPLIGHEFPFSIKMSHIRGSSSSSGSLGGGGGGAGGGGSARDGLSPTDGPGVLLLDQCLPPDTQCQFILKPSKVVPEVVPLLDPVQQKPFKRKRSLINWPFWRGSSSQLDGPPSPPPPPSPPSPPPPRGRLFGRPLGAVCPPDGGLPKPVMDMLAFLHREGPFTCGVFRRSAGAKACRELRDRLDAQDQDQDLDRDLAHHSVFVVAAVLKDFLRSVPGSLLCEDLYDQWMEAMEGDGGQETFSAVHRLVQLLPQENLLLLRHVVSLLHRIQGNAQENQMNAFNVSVCIAPSMLTPPTHTSPCAQGEGTKRVCELVRFLIENCTSILGEDVTSLFPAYSQKSSGSDHGSDVSSFQMNDSSYDSLENELNDDPESPFQDQLPLRDKPDSRSRDSVITLSDCDPDADPEAESSPRLPPLARPRRFYPAARQPRGRQANGGSQGQRRLRRSSEPALALTCAAPPPPPQVRADKRRSPARKASYDAAMEGAGEEDEEEEDEVFLEQGVGGLQLTEEKSGREKEAGKVQNGGRRRAKHAAPPPPPLRLDASCSSLSSPATSPTGSSLSSLDSAFSQYSTDYASCGAAPVEPAPLSLLFPGRSPPQREAPPQLPPRSGPAPAHGVHPNTWLRKDRRLSLRQCGHGEDEVDSPPQFQEVPTGARSLRRRSSSPPSYQQALLQLQRNQPTFFRGSEKPLTVREVRLLQDPSCTYRPLKKVEAGGDGAQPPQGVFYGQTCTTLILKRPKSHSLTPAPEGHEIRTLPRRSSEPAKVHASSWNPAASLTLERPPAPKPAPPPDANPSPPADAHLCLSPSATRAVADYFSSQGPADESSRRRSREVALAIVQGKREWQSRQCSEPRPDDFDQLFFAEESYV